LQFCGRSDRQVKIHGFRIELEEISSKINELPRITNVHSLVREMRSGKSEIVSFYTSDDGSALHDIRPFLSKHLPAYMMPGQIVLVKDVPKTLNGKVDEEKLVALIPTEDSSASSSPKATQNPTQEKLLQIWQGLLGNQKIGINQNFFELGGHSLLLAELQSKIEKSFGIKVALFDFFEFTTIEALSARLTSRPGESPEAAPTAPGPKKDNLLKRRTSKGRVA
ncbi:MAG: phosphopantetheine-binding protein, partial [Bdellovibrionota bacterium]